MSLFSEKLLTPIEMPTGFLMRALHETDYDKGFMPLLSQLTQAGDVPKDKWLERFRWMKNNGDYLVVVIEDLKLKRLAGAATAFIESKFIRNLGKAAHIEDVVVDSGYRGKNFGLKLIEQLKHVAFAKGCYKVLLDCSEKNVPFYEKAGFKVKEIQMVVYRGDAQASPVQPRSSSMVAAPTAAPAASSTTSAAAAIARNALTAKL